MTPIIAPERRKFKALLILIVSTVTTAYLFFSLFDRLQETHRTPAKQAATIDTINVSNISETVVAGLGVKLKPIKLEFVTATAPWKVAARMDGERPGEASFLEIDTHTKQSVIAPASMPIKQFQTALCQNRFDDIKLKQCLQTSGTIDKIKKALEKNLITTMPFQVEITKLEGVFFIKGEFSAVVDINKRAARKIDAASTPMYSSEKHAYFFPSTTGNQTEIKQVDTDGFYTSGTISKDVAQHISWILGIGNNKFLVRYAGPDGRYKNGVWDEKSRKIRKVFSNYDIQGAKSLLPSCTVVFTAIKKDGQTSTLIADMCDKHGR